MAEAIAETLAGRNKRPEKHGNISTLTDQGATRDIAAAKAGLGSGKTLEAAQKVVQHGAPELVEAMDRGSAYHIPSRNIKFIIATFPVICYPYALNCISIHNKDRMMKLHDLKEQRALKIAEMRNMLDSAQGKLTPDQQKAFDALKTEVTGIEAQEARAQFLEDQERRMMTGSTAESRDRGNMEGSVSILRVLQAQTEGRSLSGAEAEYAQEAERRTGRKAEGIFVPLAAFETRVNTTTTGNDLVATDHRADQYISPLRNALLARRLGVRVLSGLRGNVTMPKHGTGLSVGWVAEGGNVGDSDMSFDPVTLTPKHAGGKTEMSRQLIQQSSPDVEQLIRDDLAFAIAKALDSALILGGGTNEPVGVLSTVGIQTANLATLNWLNVNEMIEKADLENAMVSTWLTHPEAKTKLATTLKASGIAGYLLEGGRMADMPLFSTNQVPKKAGSPATGRVILGDWSQVMLGIWSEIDLLVNPYAEPAYSRGGVNVRVMTTCDVAVRHPKAFVVADDLAL